MGVRVMRVATVACAAAVIGLAIGGPLGPAGAAHAEALGDADVKARAREVLANPDYQTSAPTVGMPLEPVKPTEFPAHRPTRTRPIVESSQGSGGTPSGVSEGLLWVLGIGAGIAVLAVIVGALMRWNTGRTKNGKVTTATPIAGAGGPDLDSLPATLREARALAAAGRYEEAIHALLRGSLDYLRGLGGFTLEAAMTSREVLGKAPVEGDTRGAFVDLVGSVELSLFGGLPANADDFERCASSFEVVHRRLGERA